MKTGKKQPKLHIKRGDIVMAIAGGEGGTKKTGKVLQVFPDQGRVVVEGMNFVKKHLRKSQDNPKGGIIEKEAPIHVSNLKLYKESEHKDAAAKPAKK